MLNGKSDSFLILLLQSDANNSAFHASNAHRNYCLGELGEPDQNNITTNEWLSITSSVLLKVQLKQDRTCVSILIDKVVRSALLCALLVRRYCNFSQPSDTGLNILLNPFLYFIRLTCICSHAIQERKFRVDHRDWWKHRDPHFHNPSVEGPASPLSNQREGSHGWCCYDYLASLLWHLTSSLKE